LTGDRPDRGIRDIVLLQDAELERLKRAAGGLEEARDWLGSQLASAGARLESARVSSSWLAAEKAALQTRGPLKYWRLLKLRYERGLW